MLKELKSVNIAGKMHKEKYLISILNDIRKSIHEKTLIELSGVDIIKYVCEYYLKNENK